MASLFGQLIGLSFIWRRSEGERNAKLRFWFLNDSINEGAPELTKRRYSRPQNEHGVQGGIWAPGFAFLVHSKTRTEVKLDLVMWQECCESRGCDDGVTSFRQKPFFVVARCHISMRPVMLYD